MQPVNPPTLTPHPGHTSVPVWVREHPPPSCGEHIAIGCRPVPGCADWLAWTLSAYNWPVIFCVPHPLLQPAVEQSGAVDTQRGRWCKVCDVFLAPYQVLPVCSVCSVCVKVCQCLCVWKRLSLRDRGSFALWLGSALCSGSEQITLCQAQ